MKKIEYKVLDYKLSQDDLDVLGLKGWELVSYTKTFVWLFVYDHKYIFKREIQA